MKVVRKVLASMMLLAGVGLWVCAAGSPAVAAEPGAVEMAAEADSPDAKCWECVKNIDCDATCGVGAGYCQWNGCTRCLCTM